MAVNYYSPVKGYQEGAIGAQTIAYNKNRNALAQQELANVPGEMARRNALLDEQIKGAQQGNTQSAARFQQGNEQDDKTWGYNVALRLTQARDPNEFGALADAIAADPRAQRLGIRREMLTPERAQQIVQQQAVGAGVAPAPQPVPFEQTDEYKKLRLQQEGNLSIEQLKAKNARDLEAMKAANASSPASNPAEIAKIEGVLRKEFTDQAKPFVGVAESYQRIRDSVSDPSAAGDLALIFNYMKVLDPGSTVREGEFATAQQAGSVPARILAQYNKVLNGERLAPEQRADFFSRATKLYQGQETRFNKMVKERYTTLAKQQGLNPENVVIDVTAPTQSQANAQPTQQSTAPVTVNSPEEAMRLPSGTRFRTPDGREKVRP